MTELPDPPDAITLVHALGLLAQSWGCTVAQAQERIERTSSAAVAAAGSSLDMGDLAPRDLAELLLRRDLAGFDARVRQACRRSTLQEYSYPDVGGFERWGFQDDGPLRSAQAAASAARKAAASPTRDGLLAAVAYAEAMCALCLRKQHLLKNRTSADFTGYSQVKQSTEDDREAWLKEQRQPRGRRPIHEILTWLRRCTRRLVKRR